VIQRTLITPPTTTAAAPISNTPADDQHDAGQVLMLKLGNAPDEPSGGHDDACADEDSAYAEKQLSAVVKGAKLAIERFTDAIEAVGPVRLDDALAFFFARQD